MAEINMEDIFASDLASISKDFKRLRDQKARRTGGVEARTLLSLAFKWGEQYVSQRNRNIVSEVLDENKLHLIFNMIARRVEKLIGRLFAFDPPYKARPDKSDPKATAEAEVVDKLIKAVDEKVDQPMVTWQILDWVVTAGTAFEYIQWTPNVNIEPIAQFDEMGNLLFKDITSQEVMTEEQRDMMMQQQGVPPERFEVLEEPEMTGDVTVEVLSPLNVFIDQSVKSIEGLAPDQAVYVAKMRTMGWVLENYENAADLEPDRELSIISSEFRQEGEAGSSLFLKDLIPTIQGTNGKDDPPMALVVERYLPQSLTNPRGRYTVFVPEKQILFDGENPYKEIPLVDYHWQPVTTTFWTKDYITDLIAPQRFLNKRLSQLGEQANASIYDKILLGGNLTEKDIPTDYPGVVKSGLSEEGNPMVARLPGPQLPNWFLESIQICTKMLNDLAGGVDLTEDTKFPGQMRGPLAVPLMQEIMDTAWGPFYNHLGSRMAKAKQIRLNIIKEQYPALRTMHYTDRNQRDEVLVFHAEDVLRSGTTYNITVERGALLPELRALRESRVRERLQSPLGILYTDERTGRLDRTKIASDLAMGDSGRESREAQSRKFSQQIIKRLWQAEQTPPAMQFWDHMPMMDELEAEMMTTEFLSASPQIQKAFMERYNQHAKFMQQAAEREQMGMQNQMVQQAVAQATQQAAAQAAAATVESVGEQTKAQSGATKDGIATQAEQFKEQAAIQGQQQKEGRANRQEAFKNSMAQRKDARDARSQQIRDRQQSRPKKS
jgi:hypothetical protein